MTNPYLRPDYFRLFPVASVADDVEDGYSIIAMWHHPDGRTFVAHDGRGYDAGDDSSPFDYHTTLESLDEVTSVDDVVAFAESAGFPSGSRMDFFLAAARRHFDGE